jgi:hypothetical protein
MTRLHRWPKLDHLLGPGENFLTEKFKTEK